MLEVFRRGAYYANAAGFSIATFARTTANLDTIRANVYDSRPPKGDDIT
jgi:hypothetical protein